ncbi:MAG: 4-(cytidine 5'-diphospho)-2-C-methyl-D-erythritol kinase [Acidimicrobiia bacterium]|nr:MAG: 4-(cytidine 5'-diphospho)-2-C-methyl-D-erythritol kinase [Acidimicrobiia bacterium]
MKAVAYAKVNLALAVYRRSADGYHPLRGIFQSVSLSDDVVVTPASEDSVTVTGGEAPKDESNLAWQAIEVARRTARITAPVALEIVKRIPPGAGLGGGSADAAAALGLLAARFGLDGNTVVELAQSLGSDVPFSFAGGTRLVEGRGERLREINPLSDFALGIVVPPFSFSTPAVFSEWDRLDGPIGDSMDDRDLPPSLRGGLPIRNDLFPAAASLDPRVAQWRDEIAVRWKTGVAMTGSGSALFAFFSTVDEAHSAVAAIDIPTRATEAVEPVRVGWERVDV